MLKNPFAAYQLPGVSLVVLACLGALALSPAPGLAQTSCSPAPTRLCLQGSRFQAEVAWMVPGLGVGQGQAVAMSRDTGLFWFFSSSNVELMVKVLDGRAVNGHFWVFYSGLSDVAYILTVTDLETGAREVFTNPQGRLASVAKVDAFNAEAPGEPETGGTVVPGIVSPEAPVRQGPEFQANVQTAGDQLAPAVAMASDGGFMVVWAQDSAPYRPSTPLSLWGRIYDASGAPRTGEIRLSAAPLSGFQSPPRVAAGAGGRFMAVWTENARLVHGRIYGPDGQPVGETAIEIAAGSEADSPYISYPDVTADPAGGFLVAWIENGDLGLSVLGLQRIDAQGNPVGGTVRLNGRLSSSGPRLATLPGGGFLAAWSVLTSGVDSLFSELWLQRLDASGQGLGDSFQATPEIPRWPGVAEVTPVVHPDGGYSLLWTSNDLFAAPVDGIYARRFTADGQPAGPFTQIVANRSAAASAPAAIPLPSGDTWVLWSQTAGEGGAIHSGLFDPAWAPKGAFTRIDTYPLGLKKDPAAAGIGGRITAFWSSGIPNNNPLAQDGDGFGIFGQRFTPAPTCAQSSSQLCLGGRFRVEVRFTDPRNNQTASATPVPMTGDTGAFWFFDRPNLELIVKVLDGRAVNGRFWVFYGALSNVGYTITVTDTVTGAQRTYRNNPGQLVSGADVSAF